MTIRSATALTVLLSLATAQVMAFPGGRGRPGGGGRGGIGSGRVFNPSRARPQGGRTLSAGQNLGGGPAALPGGGGQGQSILSGGQGPFELESDRFGQPERATGGEATGGENGSFGLLRQDASSGSPREGAWSESFGQGATAARGNLPQTAGQWQELYGSEYAPFTAGWYLDHPNAWQLTHPYADAFVATTFATATAWLGATATAGYGADGSTGAAGDYAADDEATDEAPTDSNDAALPDGDWLALGVFAVGMAGQSETNNVMQLAMDRQGNLRGTYYDLLSDATQAISGNVDVPTQVATWTIADNAKVVFEAKLQDLTQDQFTANVRFPNGQRQWVLVRIAKP